MLPVIVTFNQAADQRLAGLHPRTAQAIGGLRAVGPMVDPFTEAKVVMIGDRPRMLLQRLGVPMRVPRRATLPKRAAPDMIAAA